MREKVPIVFQNTGFLCHKYRFSHFKNYSSPSFKKYCSACSAKYGFAHFVKYSFACFANHSFSHLKNYSFSHFKNYSFSHFANLYSFLIMQNTVKVISQNVFELTESMRCTHIIC